MAKKSLTLIMGMGPKGKMPMGDEGEDLAGSEKASAGKALAAAIKGGDGAEIADAFQMLYDVCHEGGESKDHEAAEDEGESESEKEEY
jgi:hypothetical protein